MEKENVATVPRNDYKDCTMVTANTNTILTNPSTVVVTTGKRVKIITIISLSIAGVLIVATVAIVPTVLLKKNSNVTKGETTTTKPRKSSSSSPLETTTTDSRDSMEFIAQKIYSTGSAALPVTLAVVDVNNDKKADIIVANQYGHNVGVLLNSGNGTFLAQTTYPTGENSHPQHVSVVDINDDDKPDVIVAANGVNSVAVFFNSGNGTFLFQGYYQTGEATYPPSLTVADINHDQKPDIIVANQNENTISILFNSDGGIFTSHVKYPFAFGVGLTSPVVADVSGDSNPDIIFANYGANSVTVLFNIGDGTFVSSSTYSTGNDSYPIFLSIADVNQDDKLDIIVANSEHSNVGILLNSDNGTFLPQTTYSTGNDSDPRCVSVVDLNGDNKPEIIVVNRDANNIGILINFGNGTFLLQKTYSTGLDSSPRFVSVVDVNGDDKPDIIVANSHKANVGVMLAA